MEREKTLLQIPAKAAQALLAGAFAFAMAFALQVSPAAWQPAFADDLVVEDQAASSTYAFDMDDAQVIGTFMDDYDLLYAELDQRYDNIDFSSLCETWEDGMIAVINGDYSSPVAPLAPFKMFSVTAEDCEEAEIDFEEGMAPDFTSGDFYCFWVADDNYDMYGILVKMPASDGDDEPEADDTDCSFIASIDGEELKVVSCEEGGYSYTNSYSGGSYVVDLYTVLIPRDAETVDVELKTPRLIYNYKANPATDEGYLAGWVDDYLTGSTSATVEVDHNGDGILDFIQVQRPYNADLTGAEPVFAIKFQYDDGQVNGTASQADLDALYANLATRFAANGSDAAVTNATFYAALALNAQGEGAALDADAILEELQSAKGGDFFSAGTYAKYITALTAAGVDCHHAVVDGREIDLVAEMEEMIDVDTIDVWSAVVILPVYSYNLYQPGDLSLVTSLVNVILDNQDAETGLVGSVEWNYVDSQTTAQAYLALLPYASVVVNVEEAADAALDGLAACQNTDGGYRYTLNDYDTDSNLDATANIVMALTAAGVDCNAANAYGSSALGYLVALADEGLASYKDASPSNESMSASTVLGAIAAALGEVNVYEIDEPQAMELAAVKLAKTSVVYNGKAQEPAAVVTVASGRVLTEGVDYEIAYADNKNVGTATATVTGKGSYSGELTAFFKIAPASQKVTTSKTSATKSLAAAKSGTYKGKLAKAWTANAKTGYKFSAKTTLSFAKSGVKVYSASKKKWVSVSATGKYGKYFAVTSGGKVTVKAGLPKGSYALYIKGSAKATGNYKAASNTVSLVVKVK